MTRALVLGGARSGKSTHAERLAIACSRDIARGLVSPDAPSSSIASGIVTKYGWTFNDWLTAGELSG